MKPLKVMTVIGTRPEIIKLSEIMKKCDLYFDHTIVHTGQNYAYTLNEIFFKDMGIREPDFYLEAVGENLGSTIGNIIQKSYELFVKEMPDALLILGDTNSVLCAISAKRLKIPVFHLEAGNRCFDENLPEEINRRIVDHISDVNLPYSEYARRNLLAEGLRREHTFVVGSPMAEVLKVHKEKISKSNILSELAVEKGKYILLSAHREENIDREQSFFELMNAVNTMAEEYKMPIIYSMHPRSEKFIKERGFEFNPLVRKMEPFGFSDYVYLQQNAFCVVSDSGTLAEESSTIHFPCVSVRTSTERQEAVDKGNLIIGSITAENVLRAVDMAVSMEKNKDIGITVPDYADENVSVKVVKIIQSYTSVINETVWRKNQNARND